MILVKRVGRQESGLSKDNSTRVRGPYLYITKRWLRYFPSLSSTQENDAAPLVIESRDYKRVVLPFVWHNSHAVQNKRGGRNEYRLYITGLESTGIPLPIPGDLVLLQPIARREGDGPHDRFTLIVVKRRDPLCEQLLMLNTRRDNYWEVRDDQLLECRDCPTQVSGVRASSSGDRPNDGPRLMSTEATGADGHSVATVPVLGASFAQFLKATPESVLAARMSSQTFREVVLAGYEGKCAVTGTALTVGAHLNVEAAHIHPRAHGGLNLPSNGIALSRDMHWGFDKGAFTIGEDFTVEVHPDLRRTGWARYHGQQLRLPADPFFRPSFDAVRHHRERVYGQFRTSGSLRQIDAE